MSLCKGNGVYMSTNKDNGRRKQEGSHKSDEMENKDKMLELSELPRKVIGMTPLWLDADWLGGPVCDFVIR